MSWSSSKESFQATFEHDNLEKIANFSKDGAWTLTTASIPIGEVEQCILDLINQEYPESDILGSAFVETPESEKYLITIEMGQNDFEEETEDEDIGEFDSISIRLMFSPDCEFLGEE